MPEKVLSRNLPGVLGGTLFSRCFWYTIISVLTLVDRLFPGQTSAKYTRVCLNQSLKEWVDQSRDIDDQTQLEEAAEDFLGKVEEGIRNLVVFVPLEGLKLEGPYDLQIARCLLCRNHEGSELMKLVQQGEDRLPEDLHNRRIKNLEQVSAFFKVDVSGHPRQGVKKAREEAELALNVLELFVGSYFRNVYQNSSSPRRMGIAGTLPAACRRSLLFVVGADQPLEDQLPGSSAQYTYRGCIELSCQTVEKLRDHWFPHINHFFCPDGSGARPEISGRLLRVVNWFGKASRATSIAESFLMYAISIESLLSEGRTPKETYANRIAALLIQDDVDGLRWFDGHLSARFVDQLRDVSCKREQSAVVEERVIELFNYRNDVAHGRVLEDEIDILNLLDLENLVRNSILSFLKEGWYTLDQFKEWLSERHQYDSLAA